MEQWSDGVVKRWSGGVLEYGSNGVLASAREDVSVKGGSVSLSS